MDATLREDDVAYAGVRGQRRLLREGRLTSLELVDLCLARVDRLDGRLRAFRTVLAEQARAEARAADEARAGGDDRPLLGVPVAVKDNVPVAGVAPSMGTGSPEPVAAQDAEQVRRLRAAGAVVLGTTTLPELALWPFTESATWGDTRNPWSTAHTPGGSSGGSAAAVAAGLVAAATASDGGGSIRIPAACTHLVGLKPTRGTVPLAGGDDLLAEHWLGLSSAGVLTRDVEDQALVLSVMAGRELAVTPPPDGLRIAWSTRGAVPTPLAPAVRGALQGVLQVLRGLGHDVVEADPDHRGVQVSFLTRYLAGAVEDFDRLADPTRTEPRTRAVVRVGRRQPASVLARGRAAGRRTEDRPLPGGADVLVTPVLPGPPQEVGRHRGLATLAGAGRQTPYTVPWNVSGKPAMSLPAGLTSDGLPLAVQLVAAAGAEELLLRLAAQVEHQTGFPTRRPALNAL